MRPEEVLEEEQKEESVEKTSDGEFSDAGEEATIDGLVTPESATFKVKMIWKIIQPGFTRIVFTKDKGQGELDGKERVNPTPVHATLLVKLPH
jgi:hypothetical protein